MPPLLLDHAHSHSSLANGFGNGVIHGMALVYIRCQRVSGSFVLGSVVISLFEELNSIQTRVLRICYSSFRTTPVLLYWWQMRCHSEVEALELG